MGVLVLTRHEHESVILSAGGERVTLTVMSVGRDGAATIRIGDETHFLGSVGDRVLFEVDGRKVHVELEFHKRLDRAKLGFVAPCDVTIHRGEVQKRVDAESSVRGRTIGPDGRDE